MLATSEKTRSIRGELARRYAKHHYYERAECNDWLASFWGEGRPFVRYFEQLELSRLCEFACGHGRHTWQVRDRFDSALLVDINRSCIDACRARFADYDNVDYLVSNGANLDGIPDASLTSLFSYDAMVHFEATDVINHLFEFARVLAPRGHALIHYSNEDGAPLNTFRDHKAGRSYFSEGMMLHFADRAGFRILECEPITNHTPTQDGLVLLEKAG